MIDNILDNYLYLDQNKKDLLEKFYNIHQSAKLNLTAIKSKKDFYIKHYLDSVFYFNSVENSRGRSFFNKGNRLADIGSGGGFPGMVLAIIYPQIKVTLIESIGKKCIFLEDAVRELGLDNVEVIHSRVEDIKNREFDYITVRGVSRINTILKYIKNILADKFVIILYKGEKLTEELQEASSIIDKWGLNIETIRVEKEFNRSYCIISSSM